MLDAADLICFIATSRPADALAFYRNVLGLALIEDGPFALVFSSNGRMLRVQKVARHVPPEYSVLGWRVDDIGAEVDALTEDGVVFARYPGMPQDDHGIWTTPGGDRVAWFRDPDGNTLSLTQFAA